MISCFSCLFEYDQGNHPLHIIEFFMTFKRFEHRSCVFSKGAIQKALP